MHSTVKNKRRGKCSYLTQICSQNDNLSYHGLQQYLFQLVRRECALLSPKLCCSLFPSFHLSLSESLRMLPLPGLSFHPSLSAASCFHATSQGFCEVSNTVSLWLTLNTSFFADDLTHASAWLWREGAILPCKGGVYRKAEP